MAFTCNVANSGTYDVFIDGVKQATTTSGTATEIQWSSLALSSGYYVTYPAALKTHVVRITPTSSSDTLTKYTLTKHSGITASGAYYYGILWCHFSLTNSIDLRFQLLSSYANDGVRNLLAETITATNDTITTANELGGGLVNCTSLKTVPTFYCPSSSVLLTRYFEGCAKLKRVSLKGNFTPVGGVFKGCTDLEEIKIDGKLAPTNTYNLFDGCTSLKKLPALDNTSMGLATDWIKNAVSLQDTVLDFSSASSIVRLSIYGDATHFVGGIKGITVSSSAPFSNTTSPQINVSYTGLDRVALVNLFNSMPTVTDNQVIDVTGTTGADNLTESDLAIATGKGWTVTR